MKRIFLILSFVTLSIVGYSQTSTFGGIGLRVTDSTTYRSNATSAHNAGYYDIYLNAQATTKHWDIWNGSSYDHIFDFNGGSSSSNSSDSTWIDVKNYFPDGVTLATSTEQQRVDAWQAAITAAQNGSYGIKFSGTWDLPTDELVFTEPVSIMGIGYGSALTTTDNSGTLLLFNAPVPRVYYNVIFPEVKPFRAENFVVQYRGSATPTSTQRGIKVEVDTSISFLHKFINITVDSFYVGMQFHNVASAEVTGCYFRNNRAYGFQNTNDESLDYGKLMMHHNVFTTVGPLTGEPDTTAHVKIEGGAGFDISHNDFYGNTDYAVWTYLRNTSEYFTAFVSSEYRFKNNTVLFVNDYAFLFMSNYGSSAPGTMGSSRTGNRIQNVQIQGNNTGFNGLIKTDGGVGSMYEFQITENFSETPLGGPTHSVNGEFRTPISLDGNAMTNVVISDNSFVRTAVSTSSTSQKPITITGTISGKVSALGNSYGGYTGVSDIETYNSTFGIGRSPVVSLDVTGTGNVYGRFTRPNNANDNGVIFTPAGALSGSNPQFFMGIPAGQSYYTFQRFDGTTATNILNVASGTNNIGIGVTVPTARLSLPASTTTVAPLNIPTGTAPSSPNNGDIWIEGTDIKIRLGGTTYTLTKTP